MRIALLATSLVVGVGGTAVVHTQGNTSPAAPCTTVPLAVAASSVDVDFAGTYGTISWGAPSSGCVAAYKVSINYRQDEAPSYYDAPRSRSLTVWWNDEQPRWLRVRGVNDAGVEGPPTPSLRFQRLFCTQLPPPPANLRVLSHGSAGTELAWNTTAVPNCSVSYLLTAAQSPGGGAGDLQWTTAGTKLQVQVPPGVRWYFRVYARTDAGFSIESHFVTVDPLPVPAPLPPLPNPCPVPASPTNVTTTIAGRTLTIGWEVGEGVCAIEGFWLTAEQVPDGPRLGGVTVPAETRAYAATFEVPVAFWLRVYVVRGGVLSVPSEPALVVVP